MTEPDEKFRRMIRRAKRQRRAPKRQKDLTRRGMLAHGYVYILGVLEGCHKIGFTLNPQSRLNQLSNLPVKLKMRKVFFSSDAWMIEKYLHTAFSDVRTNGEWFRLTEDHLAMIDSITRAHRPESLPESIQARHREQQKRLGTEYICKHLTPPPSFKGVNITPRQGMTDEDVIAAVAKMKGIKPNEWIAENISDALTHAPRGKECKLDGIQLAVLYTAKVSREILEEKHGIQTV